MGGGASKPDDKSQSKQVPSQQIVERVNSHSTGQPKQHTQPTTSTTVQGVRPSTHSDNSRERENPTILGKSSYDKRQTQQSPPVVDETFEKSTTFEANMRHSGGKQPTAIPAMKPASVRSEIINQMSTNIPVDANFQQQSNGPRHKLQDISKVGADLPVSPPKTAPFSAGREAEFDAEEEKVPSRTKKLDMEKFKKANKGKDGAPGEQESQDHTRDGLGKQIAAKSVLSRQDEELISSILGDLDL